MADDGARGVVAGRRVWKDSVGAFARALWKSALDLLFPAFCLGCGKEGIFLCDSCASALPLQNIQVCPYCHEESGGGVVCAGCANENGGGLGADCAKEAGGGLDARGGAAARGGLDALISASVYAERTLMAEAIHALKYDFVRELANPLAGIMNKTVVGFWPDDDLRDYIICPVPLHKKRQNWRGFNQAELLARKLSVKTGAPVMNLLERTTFSSPQMELKKEQRALNVRGAFRYGGEGAPPPKILLADDVATTLATLNECARALKAAGARCVKAIVLARAY